MGRAERNPLFRPTTPARRVALVNPSYDSGPCRGISGAGLTAARAENSFSPTNRFLDAKDRAMKLMWFHLMPYTELPDDFREKHPSVWVDIHSSLFDPRRAHLMYNDFMDELEFAAECGFDAVCVNEHHSNGYGLMPSPNLIASALSRRTT